ncbi:MAG: protoporphyrinogen oxidase [Candidatus Zixiibacteriota bacterium]
MTQFDTVIIGGGISGLSLLHYLRTGRSDKSVVLIEAENRLGGTIGTDIINGFSFDWGPNGFLDREPLTLELCNQLGLNDQLEKANSNISNRFILRKGKLRQVPMSPPKFITSDILSLLGKLRVMMEPFIRSIGDENESIYRFAQRRIGTAAADYLIQPMVSGIYGGIAERLSLESCFPTMREMETEYGSLFKAMTAKGKKAKAEKKKPGGPGGPTGWLTSFDGGLYKIIEQMSRLYSDFIQLCNPVINISRDKDNYLVNFKNSEMCTTKNVVLATPSFVSGSLVAGLSPDLSNSFHKIEYAPIAVVCLGFNEKSIKRNLDGFGFLVPAKENRKILGSIWTSSIFKNRAPDRYVQLRTMIGGDGNHNIKNQSNEEILSEVISDLNDIIGISEEPVITRIYRWNKAIPQFKIGHANIIKNIESELNKIGNLYITGNAYYGIGLNDCIKQSHKVAQILLNS